MISNLPQRVVKYLEFVGFTGDRVTRGDVRYSLEETIIAGIGFKRAREEREQ